MALKTWSFETSDEKRSFNMNLRMKTTTNHMTDESETIRKKTFISFYLIQIGLLPTFSKDNFFQMIFNF